MSSHAKCSPRSWRRSAPTSASFTDPTRPTVEIETAWNTVQKTAKGKCSWHELRTRPVATGTKQVFRKRCSFGWSSRRMIERYSHIRTEARREAMNALTLKAPTRPEEKRTWLSPKKTAQTRIMCQEPARKGLMKYLELAERFEPPTPRLQIFRDSCLLRTHVCRMSNLARGRVHFV